jgi:histidinol-phosphate aminotransferase
MANFVVLPILRPRTMERDDDHARTVCERLQADFDISVRYIGEQLGCQGCLRITVGTQAENDTLLKCLKDILLEC